MQYRVVYHGKAEAELDELYEHVASLAGLAVAGNYIDGIHDFIDGLTTFPERGAGRKHSRPSDHRLPPQRQHRLRREGRHGDDSRRLPSWKEHHAGGA